MRRGNARLLLNAVFAASIEGLAPPERADFIAALDDRPQRPRPVRSRPSAPPARPALRSVPALAPARMSPERLAAIRAQGGEVTMNEGA